MVMQDVCRWEGLSNAISLLSHVLAECCIYGLH